MTFTGLALDPSRVVGALGFAVAAGACAFAASRSNRPVWRAFAVLQLLFLLETLVGLRYRIHDVLVPLAQRLGWYAGRAVWQSGAIAALAVLGVGVVAVVARRHRGDAAARIAILGSAAAAGLLALEAISLHRIDAMMYATAGPIAAVAWLWLGAAMAVTAAALSLRR